MRFWGSQLANESFPLFTDRSRIVLARNPLQNVLSGVVLFHPRGGLVAGHQEQCFFLGITAEIAVWASRRRLAFCHCIICARLPRPLKL